MTTEIRIPSLDRDKLFIGDGGLETTMIFERGIELPEFASFLLLETEDGRQALIDYYRGYLEIARRHGLGFTLDTPTWRANRDWGEKLGYSPKDLDRVNRDAVALAQEIRVAEETAETPIAICGTLGPRGDAYHPDHVMSPVDAQRYHAAQIDTFAEAGVDLVGAYTLAYAEEAAGIVAAAVQAGLPVSISFTVETDGRLPSGQELDRAITFVDAETDRAAESFMVNCAHPTHFGPVIERGGAWLGRLGGMRANASRKSHAELDQAPGLDSGDPEQLGAEYRALKPRIQHARVLGGCCGTDTRHVARICEQWLT
jgi:S-methylmethionine-dependent homocysteine/selenocysteine methylase